MSTKTKCNHFSSSFRIVFQNCSWKEGWKCYGNCSPTKMVHLYEFVWAMNACRHVHVCVCVHMSNYILKLFNVWFNIGWAENIISERTEIKWNENIYNVKCEISRRITYSKSQWRCFYTRYAGEHTYKHANTVLDPSFALMSFLPHSQDTCNGSYKSTCLDQPWLLPSFFPSLFKLF